MGKVQNKKQASSLVRELCPVSDRFFALQRKWGSSAPLFHFSLFSFNFFAQVPSWGSSGRSSIHCAESDLAILKSLLEVRKSSH